MQEAVWEKWWWGHGRIWRGRSGGIFAQRTLSALGSSQTVTKRNLQLNGPWGMKPKVDLWPPHDNTYTSTCIPHTHACFLSVYSIHEKENYDLLSRFIFIHYTNAYIAVLNYSLHRVWFNAWSKLSSYSFKFPSLQVIL